MKIAIALFTFICGKSTDENWLIELTESILIILLANFSLHSFIHSGRAGADGIPGKDGRDGTPGTLTLTIHQICNKLFAK